MPSPKSILFRADSSSNIGTGHIMRDLVLADRFADAHIVFATQNLRGNINHKIEEKNHTIELLNSNNIEEVIRLVKKYAIDMVVLDHYDIDYRYEKELKEKTGVKIFVLDDTYERHFCDVLLNHNIYADEKKYKALVPEKCELRCGPKFTLLREEFLKERKKPKKRNKEKTIFLAMGGNDHSNINIKILKVLKKFLPVKVTIVTTTANINLMSLKNYVKNKKWITLHINSNKIAKLMKESDFAIVTPSVTLNEIDFLKIPFIAIRTADNQENMCIYLKSKKSPVLQKFNAYKLKNALYRLIK